MKRSNCTERVNRKETSTENQWQAQAANVKKKEMGLMLMRKNQEETELRENDVDSARRVEKETQKAADLLANIETERGDQENQRFQKEHEEPMWNESTQLLG